METTDTFLADGAPPLEPTQEHRVLKWKNAMSAAEGVSHLDC